jgi:membrane associated rhomboid family serine protease
MMQLSFGSDPQLRQSPVTRALVVLNVLFWAVGLLGDIFRFAPLSSGVLRMALGLYPSRVVTEGMYWTPFTYMFLHGNLTHLVMNMLGLYLLGPDLERAFRIRNYLLLYVLSGIAGGWGYVGVSYLLFGQVAPCVGASGAIMGLLGATVALYPARVYVVLPLMIPMRASVLAVIMLTVHLFFMLTPYGGNVAYDVHLMGGLIGYAFALAVASSYRRAWRSQLPARDVPNACVEMEDLLDRAARNASPGLSDSENARLRWLEQALRYEDVMPPQGA